VLRGPTARHSGGIARCARADARAARGARDCRRVGSPSAARSL